MKTFLITALTAFYLTGCASTPDPAKVCTADWITPRFEKGVDKIESRTKSAVRSVTRVGESLSKGDTPGPFALLSLSSAFKKLESEMTDGQGMRDIKMLARTCNDPVLIDKAMRDVFINQGFPENVFDFISSLDIYQSILRDNLEDIQSPLAPTS